MSVVQMQPYGAPAGLGAPHAHARTWKPIYWAVIFLGSFLLFLMQPVAAKRLLPVYGGTAGVWTTSMLFFQTMLLLGYLYAHWQAQLPASALGRRIHLAVLVGAAACVFCWGAPPSPLPAHPHLGILLHLGVTVGVPFFTLSTATPLLQSWYVARFGERFPYWLYSLSNAASLAGLFCFPFLFEPWLDLHQLTQLIVALLALYLVLNAAVVMSNGSAGQAEPPIGRPPVAEWLFWSALAATGSAFWMAVANHISQNLAAIPMLWVWPLGLYLLTYVVAFAREARHPPRLFRFLLPLAGLALAVSLPLQAAGQTMLWSIGLLFAALFVGCLFLHGELARRKPNPSMLTPYYLSIAGGGAAGGLFVALLAPAIFNHHLELPFCVVVIALLAATSVYGLDTRRNKLHLGLLCAALVLLMTQIPVTFTGERLRERNFYGVITVADQGQGEQARRILYHGRIQHGVQFLSPERRRIPTAYYGRNSGAGLLLQALAGRPRRVALIGMGIGTLAAYGEPGDLYRFYEINTLVAQVARESFFYLRDSRAHVEIEIGDGRLGLEKAPQDQPFDAILVDAFSGDAIPNHLITREALLLYLSRLKPEGAVAFHITNKYLDLYPVLARIAESVGCEAGLVESSRIDADQVYSARWTVVARNHELLGALGPTLQQPQVARGRVWTDGYSNLLEALLR